MSSLNYKLKVKVNPNTSQKQVQWRGDHLKVNLTAPPEDGKANQQLLELLAEMFDLSTADLELVQGTTDEYKVIRMKNLDRETLVRVLNDK